MAEMLSAEALRVLRDDPVFSSLRDYVPSLSLLRAAGIARDEVAHSRILTELLDPKIHRGAGTFLRALLMNLLADPGLDATTDMVVREMLESSWHRVAVHRELFLIDVVVELTTACGSLVLGIENKIDAAEQQDQLARYQETLNRSYPHHTTLMVFLTPQGRQPTTNDPCRPVPVAARGYDWILETVRQTAAEAKPDSREERVLCEFATHLQEEILGENEVRSLARELWRTHGRALELALAHRPQLDDIRDQYVALLMERYGEDAHFNYWPARRGSTREIHMSLYSWVEAGFPFTFMLYVDAEGIPQVRALLWRDNYNEYAGGLTRWARYLNVGDELAVDEAFTPLRNWTVWRRIFQESDYPEEAALSDRAFDEDTAEAAANAVTGLVEKLRPYIQAR